MAQVASSKEARGRWPKKTYYLGEMGSTPISLKFWVVAGEQVPAFENVPNL